MEVCKISVYLAYGMGIYVFASLYYIIFTMNIGTPFKNSLSSEQLKIKKEASKKRGMIFLQGIFCGLILCLLFKPLKKC